jgi:hypothetical protein
MDLSGSLRSRVLVGILKINPPRDLRKSSAEFNLIDREIYPFGYLTIELLLLISVLIAVLTRTVALALDIDVIK